MMVSPQTYGDHIQDKSYLELIRERDRLIHFLKDFEKKEKTGDRSSPDWQCCPKPDVVYQMYLEYLAVICGVMQKKYNEEYVWGRRTLKQDAEEKENGS